MRSPTADRYVTTTALPSIIISDLDGVGWFTAKAPMPWHRCWAQTIGFMDGLSTHRCACGSFSRDGVFWTDRNSKARSRRGLLVIGAAAAVAMLVVMALLVFGVI